MAIQQSAGEGGSSGDQVMPSSSPPDIDRWRRSGACLALASSSPEYLSKGWGRGCAWRLSLGDVVCRPGIVITSWRFGLLQIPFASQFNTFLDGRLLKCPK
jgi:hypothetical protein